MTDTAHSGPDFDLERALEEAELAREREQELRRTVEKLSEVMSTLGELSHKINNPLTSLMGRAQLLQSQAGTDPAVVKAAGVIQESATRIAELVRELATVVRDGRNEQPGTTSVRRAPSSGGP